MVPPLGVEPRFFGLQPNALPLDEGGKILMLFGADSRVRTDDIHVGNVMLYQTELYPRFLDFRLPLLIYVFAM